MGSGPENLKVLNDAQQIADEMWSRVSSWDGLARDVVGVQVARAVDSIGANVAEAFGRFHYADKIRFLYYARGSLFETKFWVRRAEARGLIGAGEASAIDSRLTQIAMQLNALVRDLRSRSKSGQPPSHSIREPSSGASSFPDLLIDDPAAEDDFDLPVMANHEGAATTSGPNR